MELDHDVAAAPSLSGAVAVLHRSLEVERVSIARVGAEDGTFTIVASAGQGLLASGVDVPIELSTQITRAMTGVYVGGDFDHEPGWCQPVDRLTLGLGFHCGCSVPVVDAGATVGVISLSCVDTGVDLARRLDELTRVAPRLGPSLRRRQSTALEQILVCHDDDLVAEGLLHLVGRELGATTERVDMTIKPALAPTAVLCGSSVDGRAATAVRDQLRRWEIDAPIIVIADRDSLYDRQAAAEAGAHAFIPLTGGADAVVTALILLRAPHAKPHVLGSPDHVLPKLTRRELDVLRDLDDGLRFKEIAARRQIRLATVKGYARSLFAKLDAHSRTETVNRARELGLIHRARGGHPT